MRAAGAILRKDLEDALRSQTLVLVLLGPVLLSMLFARAFSDQDMKRPELAVYDPGASGLVRQLAAAELVELRVVETVQQGRGLVEQGETPAFLSVPEGFDESLAGDEFPRLDLVVDESSRVQVSYVREVLRSALRELAGQDIPADVRVEKVREFTGGPRKAMLPVWVVFTALSGLMVGSSSLVEEKDGGTLIQVLTAPVGMVEVIVGKIGAGFLLAVGSTWLVLGLNGVTLGPANLAVTAAGCLAFASLGVLIGLFAKGQSAANAATSAAFMVLFIPVALADFSQVMSQAALWSPAYYLQEGVVRTLMGGAGITDVASHLAILLLTFAGICLAGVARLRQSGFSV